MITLYIDNQLTVGYTRGYYIKPTNSTCNIISCFRLKDPCSSLRGQKPSNFNYCRKVLSKQNILINMKKNVRQNPCCVGSLLQFMLSNVIP